MGLEKLFTLRTVEDTFRIKGYINAHHLRSAVLAGSGFIRLELGLKVTIVQRPKQLMNPLDPDMAAFIHSEVRRHGIKLALEHTKEKPLRIAVTYENGEIFQHFGHTEQFKLYDTEDGKILSSKVVDTNGSGHGALAGILSALHADTLICGSAQAALAQAEVRTRRWVPCWQGC